MRWLKRIGVFILAVIALPGLFLAWHLYSNVPVTTEEVLRDDEEEQAARAARNFIGVIKETMGDHASRGAHAKGHACVKAWFTVDDEIEASLRHGIFSVPGQSYKSWIRFSNGASNLARSDDRRNDSRGMAIKLIGLQQDKEEKVVQVQDFLMHNNPVFFSANVEDYNRLVESENKILSFLDSPNPFKWRLRELQHVFDTLAEPPQSPLADDYFSNTAYKLGPHNIKFSSRPCSASESYPTDINRGPDFLSETMARELTTGSGCFDFMVQLQDPDKYMPIEDPSIEWKEKDSPWIKIARVDIPGQEFTSASQKQFCENLSFTPWNSLDAHRPIGQLNRIRKKVYEASSRFRHASNKTEVPLDLDW